MRDHPSERRAASAPTKSRYAQNCTLFPKGSRSPASPAFRKTTHTPFFSGSTLSAIRGAVPETRRPGPWGCPRPSMRVPVHPPPLLRRTTPRRRALQGCPAAASAGASPIRKVHCNSKSAANAVPSPAAAAQSGRPDDGTLQSPGADVGRVLARSAYSTTSVHMESTESSRESVCAERGAGGRNCLRWVGPYSHSIPSSGRICHGTARVRPHLDEDWAHPWKPGRSALCQPRPAAAASRAARRRRARRCARSRSTHGGSQRQCFGRSSMQRTSCIPPRHAAQRACGGAAASARQRLRRALGVGERRDGLCDGGGDVRRHACATARSNQPITLALSGISRLSARGGGAAASSFFKSQRRQDRRALRC